MLLTYVQEICLVQDDLHKRHTLLVGSCTSFLSVCRQHKSLDLTFGVHYRQVDQLIFGEGLITYYKLLLMDQKCTVGIAFCVEKFQFGIILQ